MLNIATNPHIHNCAYCGQDVPIDALAAKLSRLQEAAEAVLRVAQPSPAPTHLSDAEIRELREASRAE